MDKAKRARTAETPKQPSLGLKLRAPYLYPDPLPPGEALVASRARRWVRVRPRPRCELCLDHLPAQPVADISKMIDIEVTKQWLSRGLVDGNPRALATRFLDEHNPTHDVLHPWRG
jgi:hypothetical protein